MPLNKRTVSLLPFLIILLETTGSLLVSQSQEQGLCSFIVSCLCAKEATVISLSTLDCFLISNHQLRTQGAAEQKL